MGFQQGFLWGTATASYQIEGAAFEDGKGLSIWDVFSHTKGKIAGGHTGDIACDCYHRLEEDLDLMQSLGIQSYRFSISWSRILPNGVGEINPQGVDYYNRLIDGLLARGIKPSVTLYHWDLPYALHLRGGWLNEESPDWFAEYTQCVVKHFGDRVHSYMTFNEPQIFVALGYREGTHAPGYRLDTPELLRCCHNILKAHGRSVLELRKGPACEIGIANSTNPRIPFTSNPEDIEAARSSYFTSTAQGFVFNSDFWMDPIIFGKYPDWVYQYQAIGAPKITDEDLALIHQPIDFIGLNIYNGFYTKAGKNEPEYPDFPVGFARTDLQWPITPEAMYWGPYFYYERYHMPLSITENGMACHDFPALDGKVHDPNRIDFLRRYLSELKRAAESGVEIQSYHVWSLFDNFEWAEGYNARFGIIYTDYQTLERIPKDSALWYKDVIASKGENL